MDEKTKSIHYKAHHDWEGYDDISIKVVPRYKTSGLSGDEWRVSAVVTIKRKGELVYERAFSKMEAATKFLAWVVEVEMGENSKVKRGLYGHYQDECAQPGCDKKPVNHYRIKDLYSDRGEGPLPDSGVSENRRAFCKDHSTRGDCGLEDADTNYELVEGPGAGRVPVKDISESHFGGVIDLTDEPQEGAKEA